MFHCLIFASTSTENGDNRSLGSHRIATILREEGWDVEVVDFFPLWSFEELKNFCLTRINQNTKFIGFSHLFFNEPLLNIKFISWLRENFNFLKIIVGAQFAWPYSTNLVDYVVYGYGENALIELLKYLFSNGKIPIFSKFKGKCRFIDANTHYPSFPLDSLKVIYQNRDFLHSSERLSVEFSRGCKFQCAFCNYPILGVKGDYSRSQDDFYTQVSDAYDRFGIKEYRIVDETFNDTTEKITKFANVVEKLPFEIKFSASYIRADLLINRIKDREELLRMNVVGHFYGVESFNHLSAKTVGKGIDSEKLKNGLVDIKKYFKSNKTKQYFGTIGLIVGLPHETIQTIQFSYDWLNSYWMEEGCGVSVEPLQIPISEWEKPSKFSLDYKKYGYKEKHKSNGKDLIWENDHMDLYIAQKLVSEMVGYGDKNVFSDQPVYNYTKNTLISSYITKKINYFSHNLTYL